MTTSKKANVVMIPIPGMGHLLPAVELANHLVSRNPSLSVTVLLIKVPIPEEKLQSYLLSLKSNPSLLNDGVTLLDLPLLDDTLFDLASAAKPGFLFQYLQSSRPIVKRAVEELRSSGPAPVAGLLLDMFCTPMMDVANDLGLPSYIFFTPGASVLSVFLRSQELGVVDDNDTLEIPGFRNPVPVRAMPGMSANFHSIIEGYRRAKGILVNTFSELEQEAIDSMSQDDRIPPIYPVGPILNLNPSAEDQSTDGQEKEEAIFKWLDAQPPRSVVFLCFGSRGSFNERQVKEIAIGLERSGQRFLWSLRRRPENNQGGLGTPSDFEDPSGVLPEGFLERTGERGRVIGWVPQVRVLGHGAVAGFVSHCGWNSTLESLWFGVPIAAWPLYAEQRLNAFLLVREMGLAAEVKIDYKQDQEMVVEAATVEEGIRKVMEEEEIRNKVKDMSDKARIALGDGGSSYQNVDRFIDTIFRNLP